MDIVEPKVVAHEYDTRHVRSSGVTATDNLSVFSFINLDHVWTENTSFLFFERPRCPRFDAPRHFKKEAHPAVGPKFIPHGRTGTKEQGEALEQILS
jgi:hypothetical protein